MFKKIIIVVVAFASVLAQNYDQHKGNDHGHAYSSQSFVLHHGHGHAAGNQEEYHHGQEQNYHGLSGHHEENHHGHNVEHHHDHHVELQGQQSENNYGHNGHYVESQYGHQAEAHHGYHDEHHGHHGVSSQSIYLHNDGPATKHIEYYGHPKYEYAYEIKDPHTHDLKYQHESRDGDIVKGVYSLHQPDGTVRVVKYHADKKSGFNADVKFEGHAVHAVPEHYQHH